jgi:hypothetical protein
MKHLFSLTLIGLLLLSVAGCGAVFIGGAILPATTVTGSVTSVQLGSVVNSAGGTVQVTFVTLLQSSASSTIAFCSNHITQFPLNQTVSVNFNPGQPCGTIIAVVIVG